MTCVGRRQGKIGAVQRGHRIAVIVSRAVAAIALVWELQQIRRELRHRLRGAPLDDRVPATIGDALEDKDVRAATDGSVVGIRGAEPAADAIPDSAPSDTTTTDEVSQAAMQSDVNNADDDASSRSISPRLRQMNRILLSEPLVFIAVAAIFFAVGWVWLPHSEIPSKLPKGSFAVGVPDISGEAPRSIYVSEHHDDGATVPGNAACGQEATDNAVSAMPKVSVDIDVIYGSKATADTPVLLTMFVPKAAKLQRCESLVDVPPNSAYNNPGAGSKPLVDSRWEVASTPPYYDGIGSYAHKPDERSTTVSLYGVLPTGSQRLAMRTVFSGVLGIGFISSGPRVEALMPVITGSHPVGDRNSYRALSEDTADRFQQITAVVMYGIPRSEQFTWTGESPIAGADDATWAYAGSLPLSPHTASGVWEQEVGRESDATFQAGVIFGTGGAAVIAALQALYARQKKRHAAKGASGSESASD